MNKIIYISMEPLTKYQNEAMYVSNMIDAGFNVSFWDLSWFWYADNKVQDNLSTDSHVVIFKSLEHFNRMLKTVSIEDTAFIVNCFKDWHSRKIFRLLSKYRCYTISFDYNANTRLQESISSKINRLFSNQFIGIVYKKIQSVSFAIYRKIYSVKNFNDYISSSAIAKCTIRINHQDFERFKFNNQRPIISGPYIVFCDNYFPYHQDIVFLSGKTTINAEDYHRTMRRFFDYLEEHFNMPVVIAAHPKSKYVGNEFGNRKIIKYQTDNLVYNSNRVILHTSNTISYVVLSDKPISFVSTDGYEKVDRLKTMIHLLANTFGKRVYNLDRIPFEMIDNNKIDRKLREKYIYTYLTSEETENTKNIEIISNAIKALTYKL